MILTLVIIALLVLSVYIFMQQPPFGALPFGDSLKKITATENYASGMFQNIHDTPQLTEGATYFSVLKRFFFEQNKRRKPQATLPSAKTDLHNLSVDKNVLVWFGHSSYFMQVDGKKFLVDPVMSGSASPLSFTTRSFAGSDVYTTDDIPDIDFLFISHDHWDHLDYKTVKALQPRVGKVICGLGVRAHLERWGYAPSVITELNWHEYLSLGGGFEVNTVPGRHFSGRTFKRNQSLWLAFALRTPSLNIFVGGDSGYDTHFKKAGEEFGPFDLAILECGQYDRSWKFIHMLPPEVLEAAKDLRAKRLLPVHWAKFALSVHDWDAPIKELTAHHTAADATLLTPMIGEAVWLNDEGQKFGEWWSFN